jgi:hypothetical protein
MILVQWYPEACFASATGCVEQGTRVCGSRLDPSSFPPQEDGSQEHPIPASSLRIIFRGKRIMLYT